MNLFKRSTEINLSAESAESSTSENERCPKRRRTPILMFNSEMTKQPNPSSSSSGSSGGTHISETQEELIVCTEVVPCTQEEKMNQIYELQSFNFQQDEIELMKKIVLSRVVPLVKTGDKSFDNIKMWEFVRKQYNVEARQTGIVKHERRLEEVFAIGRFINWCNCSRGYEGQCLCTEPRIPSSYVDFQPMSCSGSSRKRNYESISPQSPSIEQRVAVAIKRLKTLKHISVAKAKLLSILYSNLITKGLLVPIEEFLLEEEVDQQLAHIEEDLFHYGDYAKIL